MQKNDTPTIEELLDLVEAINSLPPRYLPLAHEIACPFCYSIIHDEIDRPEEGVHKMKYQRCSGVFYFDYRCPNNVKFDQVLNSRFIWVLVSLPIFKVSL